jgi:hypothetical protein
LYRGVERETRSRLATLPQGDLEAVIRFFEALQAVRANRRASGSSSGAR